VYIAIATTAGTGSEVSRSTVITVTASNRKTVIFSPLLMPTVAIEDPELTVTMPQAITAGTGMDAFTHNVEAYLSSPYQPICDAVALGGVKLCWHNLPKVMRDGGNLEARGNMMIAAVMGATAFQKGLGAVHSLAHPLSTDAGMHHGTANAVMLPYVMEYNRPAVEERLRDLAVQMGGSKAADAIECVRQLNRTCGIHARLSNYGITRSMLPKLADKAIQDGCHQLNPRATSRDDLMRLYEQAL
jgi:alcohol dehydrogenase class IV